MTIRYEEITKKHIQGIWQLDFDAWFKNHAEADYEYVVADVNIDINNLLQRSTYGVVALDGEKVVGVALASAHNKIIEDSLARLSDHTLQDILTLLKAPDKYRQDYAEFLEADITAYENIFETTAYKAENELVLLIVSAEYHNMHVGSSLVNSVKDYFRSLGVANFYVKTDDSSNYKFYEKTGFKLIGEYADKSLLDNGDSYNFYLYGIDL